MKIFIVSLSLLFCLPALSQSSAPKVFRTVDSAVVFFDFGLFSLRQEADTSLQSMAEQWREDSSLTVRITAHTDSIGSVSNNLRLSERRAEAIEAHLKSLGLPDSIFHTTVFGERNPLADNETDEGRQLNRRATVELIRELPPFGLSVVIVDAETGEGVESTVVLSVGEDFRDTIPTNRAGGFRCLVPVQTEVQFDILAPGYFVDTKTIRTKASVNRLRFPIRQAVAGEMADIQNLYFVTDEAILMPRSEPELHKLLTFMKINPNIRIEIAGHMSFTGSPPVPKDSWQYELSYKRAKMVHDFLLAKGIEENRLSFNGYGNWEMRFPNATTEEEHRQNRRVEIRVLE